MGFPALLIALLVIALLTLNLILRNRLEHAMNGYLTHHRVSLGYAHFELLGRMLVLRDLTVVQRAHPSPPIVHLGEARMSVQWFDLVRGHIVADCIVIAPSVHLSAAQLQTEAATINMRDIRRALLEAPDFGIKRLQVLDLNVGYVDPRRRVEIQHLNANARDLRRTALRVKGLRTAPDNVSFTMFSSSPVLVQKQRGAIGLPDLILSLAQIYFTIDSVRYRDTTPAKGYALYFDGLAGHIFNLSNQPNGAPAQFELEGQFMGSGRTYAAGHIRPREAAKDLNLTFELSGLQLRSLNALFHRYGHTEVAAGQLSVDSRVFVRANHISGFVEPVITELKIQAAGDKKNASVLHDVFHSIAKGTGKLLSASHPSFSPRVDLSGSIDEAHSGLFDLLVLLARNAFLNGFEPSFNHYAAPQS